jgi:hypothetical protein
MAVAESPRLAYAQARVQSRHGLRPQPDDWRMAESTTGAGPYLDALRQTSLAAQLKGMDASAEPEALERGFRAAWREAVAEHADWGPAEWQPAVQWLAVLPDLPALAHLLAGGKVPPWLRADPVLGALAWDEPGKRREAVHGSPFAALAGGDDHPVMLRWVEAWRDRLPDTAAGDEALEALLRRLLAHFAAMAEPDADGRLLRRELRAELERRLRHGAGTMLAVFCHLLLEGLDLERARGGLLLRRVLPDRPEGRSWA